MKYNILLGNSDDDDKELAILEALASTISDEEEKEEGKCADENVSVSKATSIKREPAPLIKSVTCTKCGQLYSSPGNLQKHMKSVHGNIKFRCDQCPYEASQKIGLVKHQQVIHAGLKHYCDMCDKHYSWENDLRRHKYRVHNKIKFNCETCALWKNIH